MVLVVNGRIWALGFGLWVGGCRSLGAVQVCRKRTCGKVQFPPCAKSGSQTRGYPHSGSVPQDLERDFICSVELLVVHGSHPDAL